MPFYIRIELKEDLDALQTLIGNAVTKVNSNPNLYCDLAERVYRLNDSVNNPGGIKDAHAMGIPDEIIEEDTPEPKPNARKSKVKGLPPLCSDHKTYGAKRVPSTDCDACWKAYKKFNPLVYENKRRDFERKLGKKDE